MSDFFYDYEGSKSEKSPLLEDGPAAFKVMDAKVHTSKAGNKSLKLDLKVIRGDQSTIIYHYLSPKFAKGVKSFCAAIKRPELYNERGVLSADEVIGARGTCLIEVERSEEFGDKNKIKQFNHEEVSHPKPSLSPDLNDEADDLPF